MNDDLRAERVRRAEVNGRTADGHVRTMKSRPIEFPKWLSLGQAAEYLGVGHQTARRLGQKGEIPMYRIAREFKMRLVDVEAYIERARVIPVLPAMMEGDR